MPFDVVFLDHSKGAYLPDLLSLERGGLLSSGAVVVADNASHPRAADYLAYVRSSPAFRSRFYPFGDQLADSARTRRSRAAKTFADGVEVSTFH